MIVNVGQPFAYSTIVPHTDQILRSWYVLFFQLPTWIISQKILGNNAAWLQNLYQMTVQKGNMFVGDLGTPFLSFP